MNTRAPERPSITYLYCYYFLWIQNQESNRVLEQGYLTQNQDCNGQYSLIDYSWAGCITVLTYCCASGM